MEMDLNNPALDSAHFCPYRPDGKLVCLEFQYQLKAEFANCDKYGFVCVVTGAQQPVGQAIIHELASMCQLSYTCPSICHKRVLNLKHKLTT